MIPIAINNLTPDITRNTIFYLSEQVLLHFFSDLGGRECWWPHRGNVGGGADEDSERNDAVSECPSSFEDGNVNFV